MFGFRKPKPPMAAAPQAPKSERMSKPRCKYCGGTEWYQGPEGGMSVNILCANDDCRHWFNWTPMLGLLDDLNRVEPTEGEKNQAKLEARVAADAAKLARYNEGVKLFEEGKSARECLIDPTYGNYGEARYNLERLCGWLDTAAQLTSED